MTRRTGRRHGGGIGRAGIAILACLSLVAGPGVGTAAAADDPDDAQSTLRIGVLALAQALSAVAQTPELAEPLPFTRTSLADVLALDEELAQALTTALQGTDLEVALESLPGVSDVTLEDVDGVTRVTFGYSRTVDDHVLQLVHDDGDLRFGAGASAGDLDVALATDPDHPFVMEFDPDQPDPLLEVALVGRPEMDLEVDIQNAAVTEFVARQGFTRIDVTGGHYRLHRERRVTMRDPNGRGVLTLEDLRYSTLPDLFHVAPVAGASDQVDVSFDVQLPASLDGGSSAERQGTLSLTGASTGTVWPNAADATRSYGAALVAATRLSLVDGLTSLAKYTGATLALQDAARVEFPNVAGDTSDLFAPGDQLLDLLATSAVAQIHCGAAPGQPPVGVAAAGDTVYCSATTADGVGTIAAADWSTQDAGSVVDDPDAEKAAVGPDPTGTVQITGSDGEPDVTVTLTLEGGRTLTARSMPRTVQDVVERIDGLNEATTADASLDLAGERLAVDVAILEETTTAELGLGNPRTLGALVGLTGLDGGDAATATVTATGASYDVGFGIGTGEVDRTAGQARPTVLLPADDSLVRIGGLSAIAPDDVVGLSARIGFLGVTADVTGLSLGRVAGSDAAVVLNRPAGESGPIALDTLLNDAGALDPDAVALSSAVTAGISFTAHEQPLPDGAGHATGTHGPVSGSASIDWAPGALPAVTFDAGYERLRVFDPVPAAFLSGTARVTEGSGDEPDAVEVDVDLPGDGTLHATLGVEAPSAGEPATEVARRMVAAGPACQNVTLVDGDTLTCVGLAPHGEAAFAEGDAVELIVLGDPFALRDGIVEGLAATLAAFTRLNSDNVDDGLADDQYTSTLPLVDLTPAQLAVEREALGAGLAGLTAAATEDEGGTGDAHPSVSSAQELSAAVGTLVDLPGTDSFAPSLRYELGTGSLGLALTATTPAGTALQAPLRFTVPGPGQVGSDASFDVQVESTTTLAIDVAVATARPAVSPDTGTTSTATLALGDAELSDQAFRAGVGDVTAGTGSMAGLDVTVDTAFVAAADPQDGGALQTTRTSAGVADATHTDESPAAVADLAVGDAQRLHVHLAATDSSGGTGATQPAPEAMEVRYAAEGLDGLAAALEDATDGAAPRNLNAQGAPVSAPLIGSDLDAGAGVADTLRALTSNLRTQLGAVDAETADALPGQLEQATVDAVNATSGLDDVASATANVTCVGDECETCTTPEDGSEPECTSVGPTGWDTVSISVTLTGTEATGQVPFDTGLPALEVRSDKLVETTTRWTLPITLELARGVGPRIRIQQGDALRLDVQAALPVDGIDAIVGYLPAHLSADPAGGSVDTTVTITPGGSAVPAEGLTYDLFDLYDGELTAVPAFTDLQGQEDGLSLDFQTLTDGGSPLDLKGTIDIPWTPAGGFGGVAYNDVRMDVGAVAATMATPFEVVDPYLGPLRDVIDVLRTPIPVVSDLSELGGGGELSLLTLLETLSTETQNPTLTLVHNVIGLVDGVASMVHGLAQLAEEEVGLENLAKLGTALTVQPTELLVYEKCTQTVRGQATTSTRTGKPTCPTVDVLAKNQRSRGVQSQTTNSNRRGVRAAVEPNVARKLKEVSVSVPGFSLPFLADPNQILDVLTGEGEASYFRLDLGTLAASISYTQTFGPIMAGPVPIAPFVGGSIGIEGRLAMGFDSLPQTLAVESLPHAGDVDTLMATYQEDGFDVIEEGFYLDDLDSDGADVPEVKLVVTLEAGAGVSIGIVSAGLKGGITLTIGLDLNDPNDDGRLRTAEIREIFDGNAACVFDVKAELEAFIAIFVRIWVLGAPLEYSFDLLRLGPWTLFEYGCSDEVPQLVRWDDGAGALVLTSGSRSNQRLSSAEDVSDEYEVRQFDTLGGASAGGTTTYEVAAFGRVQRVEVTEATDGYTITIRQSGIGVSVEPVRTVSTSDLPSFSGDGGADDDRLSFLRGETFDDAKQLVATEFTTPVVALTGGVGNDLLVTGAADDVGVDGGDGDDSIDVGAGRDVARGGAGNDTMTGGSGVDDLAGDGGNDRIEGGPGADRLDGGAGDDGLVGGPGRDVRAVLVLPADQDGDADGNGVADVVEEQVRLGFDSGDVVVGGDGTDTVDGGDGADVVVGGPADSLTTTPVASLVTAGDRDVNVLTQGDTNPHTESVATTTAAVPEAQQLDALCLSGEPQSVAAGADHVTGGPEADIVIGGDGPDRLDGGGGPDEVCGRAGDDVASGDGGDIDEGSNRDIMRGGAGDDSLVAGPGDDVVFGDDVTLFRGGRRVLDGSLGSEATGDGADHLDGGDGDDVLSGGSGSDLVLGGLGDDVASGEGRDTTDTGGAAPSLGDRLLACTPTTRIVDGKVDLDGDLLAGSTDPGVTEDDGRLAGLVVDDGVVHAPGGDGTSYDGLLGEEVVVLGGLVDLDRDGTAGAGDTGVVPLASMLATTDENSDGDCILSGDGDDQLRGGSGSDFLGAGDGRDLALGGDGNDLAIGGVDTDVLLGGPHHDVLVGGEGADHLQGEDGDDRLRGNEGDDDLIGGSDTSGAPDGQDVLLGARGEDVLVAENGALVSASIASSLTGALAPTWTDETAVPAAALATAASPLRFDDSAVACGAGSSTRWVTMLASDGVAGVAEPSPGTPLAYDELYGGFDCDWVFGSPGDDLVRGGQHDDVVEGGPGADLAHGDGGDDVVVGGSSVDPTLDQPVVRGRSGEGVPDGADTIHGDGGPDGGVGSDLLLGDNATVDRVSSVALALADLLTATPRFRVQMADVATAATPAADGTSGGDTIDGGGDATTSDRVFGQGGDDTVTTAAGDDYVEGNGGHDTIASGAGDDDVIGGSSASDGRPLGVDGQRLTAALAAAPFDDTAAGLVDVGDVVDAGPGDDVVLGDNGRITRSDTTTAASRDIAMGDRASDGVSGTDRLAGGPGGDRVYGQGHDDTVEAGDGDDYVEGNAGGDTLAGHGGDDVVIGGSSLDPTSRTAVTELPADGPLGDDADTIHGDGGDDAPGRDVLLGDNATIHGVPGGVIAVQLADVPTGQGASERMSGPDTIDAGGAADRVFGQGGDDILRGGDGEDYVEGNSGEDTIEAGHGDDDVIGGSSAADGRPLGDGGRLGQSMGEPVDDSAAGVLDGVDTVEAGAGEDVVIGDNGRVTRPGGSLTSGPADAQVTQPVRDVAMADITTGATSGSDRLSGGPGDDVLYGQLDDGEALGEGDRLQGGAGADTLLGDLAVVTLTPASDLGQEEVLALRRDIIEERVYPAGSLVPVTVVPTDPKVGGPDVARGGDGADVLRLGGGRDLANGDAGDDVLFGGAGDDALWGGTEHDRLFGGYGADDLDLKKRDGDPAAYDDLARSVEDSDGLAATTNGDDLAYGGWGPDELQADVGDAGPTPYSDHLVDWVGAHNVYYVCEGAYGAGRIVRQSSPAMMDLLAALVRASGGLDVDTANSGAWYDLGLVDRGDNRHNNRKSPEHPGNFTCEGS